MPNRPSFKRPFKKFKKAVPTSKLASAKRKMPRPSFTKGYK